MSILDSKVFSLRQGNKQKAKVSQSICFQETTYVPRGSRPGIAIMTELAEWARLAGYGSIYVRKPVPSPKAVSLRKEEAKREDGRRMQVQLIERFLRANDRKVKAEVELKSELDLVEALYQYVLHQLAEETSDLLTDSMHNLLINAVCYILGGYPPDLWPIGSLICSPGEWNTLSRERSLAEFMLRLAMDYRRSIVNNENAFSEMGLEYFIEFTEELVRNFDAFFST